MWPGFGTTGKAFMYGLGGKMLKGAGVGAAVGGLYGAFSDNTSILGGAMMGGLAGAAGVGIYRKGIRPLLASSRAIARGQSGWASRMVSAASEGAKLAANQAVTPIRTASRVIKRGTHPAAIMGTAGDLYNRSRGVFTGRGRNILKGMNARVMGR